jgi:uncharacterized protein (TIGR03435 family)
MRFPAVDGWARGVGRALRTVGLLAAMCVTVRAQTAAVPVQAGAAAPTGGAGPVQAGFETASIRASNLTSMCFSMLPPGGTQYAVTCAPLRLLIGMAYKTNYIDGGGSALESSYDVRASTPEGVVWTMDTVRPMLRQLLAERFHLVVHAGKREISGYRLVVGKGGAKLHSVEAASVVQGQKAGEPSRNFVAPGRLQGRGMNAAGIAFLLGTVMQTPVVDRTGLQGVFNVDMRYAPDNSTDSGLPSLFTAVEEQLGLKLEPDKVVVDTVVVDHVDSSPTAN